MTGESSCPIDGHRLSWWFTTDGSGDAVDLAPTLAAVTRGTDAAGDTVYRLQFSKPYPLNNVVEFGSSATTAVTPLMCGASYRTGFSRAITTPALGEASPGTEVDMSFVVATAEEVVYSALMSGRASGYLVIDFATVTGSHSQA